jgi:hypothetical protein
MKPYWLFDENSMPCSCCSATFAMADGYWTCSNGRTTPILEEDVDVTQDHPASVCPGGCAQHPLTTPDFLSLLICGWGEVEMAAVEAAEAAETPEQRFKRLNREAAAAAAAEMRCESSQMNRYAEIVAIKAARQEEKAQPCKNLYCNEAAPKSEWVKNNKGKLCAPVSKGVCSECWAHEYIDPRSSLLVEPVSGKVLDAGVAGLIKTGKALKVSRAGKWVIMMRPKTCKYLHPGQPGWREEWTTDRNWKSPEQLANPAVRFAALKGKANRQ